MPKSKNESTPNSQGFRMPAEWEPHEATWLGWPHNRADWPGKISPIPWVYGEMVRRISAGERIRLITPERAHEAAARRIFERVGVDPSRIEFLRFASDRGWM